MFFVYVNLVLKKENYTLGRTGICFWGLGSSWINFRDLGEDKRNTFREQRQIISGILGDQSIIFIEPGGGGGS